MYLANPWGLLGLLALPAIVVLHLYQQRFPALAVASLHLWSEAEHVPTAGRRRDRLPFSASLFLELLAALAATLGLADLRFGDLGRVVHQIVVLDDSASMSSVGADGRSFRERAIAELDHRRQSLPYRSVWTVLLTGRRPTMLAGPAVRWNEVATALERWQPVAPRHDFSPAWDLGAQLAADNSRLLFVTDHLPDGEAVAPDPLEILSVGESRANLSLAAAEWLREAADTVFLRIHNHAPQGATARVEGTAGEQTLFQQAVDVPGQSAVSLEIPVQTSADSLQVQLLAANDALPLDSRADLVRPRPRTIRASLESLAPLAAQKLTQGLLASRDVVLDGEGPTHLQFLPGETAPPATGTAWWVGLGPLPRTGDSNGPPLDLDGPFVLERNHPLLQGVTLQGIRWTGVGTVTAPLTPLITCGDELLFGRFENSAVPAWLLNLDLERTNIAESLDWPILLANLVEARRENLPGLRRWNYRLGEEVSFRLFEGPIDAEPGSPLTLRQGSEVRPLVRAGIVHLPSLSRTGLYEIRNGEQSYDQLAVNFFDPAESELQTLGPGHRPPAAPEDVGFFPIDQPLSWWILAALLLTLVAVLGDWKVLGPSR